MVAPANTTVTPPILKAHRFLELDSLRGVAALTVVLAHFSGYWGGSTALQQWEDSPGHIFTAGHEAVVFFFVLSGFVLCAPYAGPRPPGYGTYLLKRLCRIYLPYAAAVLLAFLGAARFHGPQPGANAWINATWSQAPTWHLLLAALLMQARATQQLNAAFWSVIYEVRISLIFPLLYFFFRSMRVLLAVPIILAACLAASLLHLPGLANVFVAGLFSVGILLYRNLGSAHALLERISPTQRAIFLLTAWLGFEFTLPLLARAGFERSLAVQGFIDYAVALGAVGLIAFATRPGWLQRALTTAPLLRLGALSYSTYLVHATVLFLLIRTHSPHMNFGWLFLPYLLLVYGVSEVFYLLVDKQSVLLGRKVAGLLT